MVAGTGWDADDRLQRFVRVGFLSWDSLDEDDPVPTSRELLDAIERCVAELTDSEITGVNRTLEFHLPTVAVFRCFLG